MNAAEHFQKSLELNPRAEIYSDLGYTLERMGLDDEAHKLYRRAIEMDPNCASAHLNMGASLVEKARYEEAEPHYRAAIPGRPTASSYTSLGYVLDRNGKTDEAIAQFERAIEIDPTYIEAYNNMAAALARRGNLAAAAGLYRKSIAQNPNTAAYYALGGVLQTMGKKEEAAAEFEKARTLAKAGTPQAP